MNAFYNSGARTAINILPNISQEFKKIAYNSFNYERMHRFICYPYN
jgi:hypothetical protein